ncbi:hypothetical protein BYT27DRAFT_7193196 [Phlegmacium glaucopus]|nr:hypothetical protein BYT27DRAFT_7193196 [Phlegmacium glaucopus]
MRKGPRSRSPTSRPRETHARQTEKNVALQTQKTSRRAHWCKSKTPRSNYHNLPKTASLTHNNKWKWPC